VAGEIWRAPRVHAPENLGLKPQPFGVTITLGHEF
jgi:hypothetical protein